MARARKVAEADAPRRPVMRYHGGKWMLAPWVVSHFPPHRIYTEVYGGAASVLMQKPRSYSEIYNDLDSEVVNVFRVLRDPETACRLEHLLRCTPFAREEFEQAYTLGPNSLEQARRTIVKAFMGFGSGSIHDTRSAGTKAPGPTWTTPTGFRMRARMCGTSPAHDWLNYPEEIGRFAVRLQGVVIENRDALDVLGAHDEPRTLHYVDPPYISTTRDFGADYAHE